MALIVGLLLACLLGVALLVWAWRTEDREPAPYRPRHAAGGAS